MPQRCNVVDTSQCEVQTGKMCFSCGLPACENCSLILSYYDFGKKRICHDCIPDHYREGKQAVDWHRHLVCGYEVGEMPALDGPAFPNPLHVEVYIGIDVEMDFHTRRTLQLLSCGKDDDSIGELVRKLVTNVLGQLPSSRLTITGSRAEEEVR